MTEPSTNTDTIQQQDAGEELVISTSHSGDELRATDDVENDPYDISSMSDDEGCEKGIGSPSFDNIKKDTVLSSSELNIQSSSSSQSKEKFKEVKLTCSPSFPPSPSQSTLQQQDELHPSPANRGNTSPRHKPPPSPAGSGVSGTTTGSLTNTQHVALSMPKFYESDEDGPGSLVFVDNQSSAGGTQSSHQQPSPRFSNASVGTDGHENGSSTKQMKVSNAKNKDKKDGGDPHFLPYQQRRKLSMRDSQPDTLGVDKRPPFAPKQPLFRGAMGNTTLQPDPLISSVPAPSPAMPDKYKVAPIPPFRGSGQSHQAERHPVSNDRIARIEEGSGSLSPRLPTRKVLSTTSPQTSPEKPAVAKKVIPGSPPSDRRPPLAQTGSSKQVINQSSDGMLPPPPPPPQNTSPTTPSSPRGGYHVRVHSQTSVSSLGSNAVDSVHGDQTKQQPPVYQVSMQQQIPQNYYYGYMQQHQHQPPSQYQQQQSSGVPSHAPSVNFNDVLGNDIATFLHGERIAAATAAAPHYNEPIPSQWNPSYVHQQHHMPAQIHPEPLPPPLTAVPNMALHRARLPSISDDDWAEELEKEKDLTNEHAQGLGVTQGGVPNGQAWDFRMNQQYQAGYYNYNPMSNMYYGQHRMAPPNQGNWDRFRDEHRGRSSRLERERLEDIRQDERSSLLLPSGIHTYESRHYEDRNKNHSGYHDSNYRRSKWNGGQPRVDSEQRRRKKKKSKRRKEKEKRRSELSDSSLEDESEHRNQGKSRKSRGRRHRKRRDNDDTISDTYSESFMSQSLADVSTSKQISGNCIQRLWILSKLFVRNLPLSAASISFTIVLLGIVWFKWAEELLSSCKEVTFHSSQCSLPEFPGE